MSSRKSDMQKPGLGQAIWPLYVLVLLFMAAGALAAEESPGLSRGTKQQAVAMVKKAVGDFKTRGTKAFDDFDDPTGAFVDRDLYIFVLDSNFTTLASGANPRTVGRNRYDEQDADGKYVNHDKQELMKTQKSFWQSSKWSDPLTHKILPKLSYCEVVDDATLKEILICSGVYDVAP